MNNNKPISSALVRHAKAFSSSRALALGGLLAAFLVRPAFADDVSDVTGLMRSNQYAEAIAKADAILAKKPRDAQMRFLKGVIFTEQNRTVEAIGIFLKLTEDFPDLPEPYNNLAVLYAAQGQYEKARAALDRAIRTNPAYATAYENLGDVHAKLASQAYDKALQLDSANTAAKSKLTLVRSLVPDSTAQANAANAAAAKPAQGKPGSTVVATAPVQPAVPAAPAQAAARPDAPPRAISPAQPAATVPAPAAQPAPPAQVAKADPKPAKPEPSQPSAADAERGVVLSTVESWARAWSAKDVKAYLSYYGNEFDPPNGLSRKAWAEERQARIAGKGRISVRIDSPQVSIDGNAATVKFRQNYVSDRLSTTSRKTLVLVKQRGKWQIEQERTGG